MMNASVAVSLVASLLVGGAIGGTAVHMMAEVQVTCSAPVVTDQHDDAMAKLLKPMDVPLSGYKSY